MFTQRTDLPFGNDSNSRFLPWMVAVMVFLATIAMSGALALEVILDRWNHDVTGTMTIQIMPATGEAAEANRETQHRVDAAVKVLLTTPGVASARPLDLAQIGKLLEPWLGSTELLADLPVPRLIDVTLHDGVMLDLPSLEARLSAAAPEASVEDHQVWLSKLVRLGHGLEILAILMVGMVAVATAATVIYATRTGLAIHRSVIEVLHMIGAQDDYIARQFAHSSLMLGLRGGTIGLGLALPALMTISWLAGRTEGGLIPELALRPIHWLMLACLPLAVAYLAMVAARLTVHRALIRMT
ncbi:MAG: cell division protein [Alphaproteobacteria bacterium]|nr:cell division protein [Alphaproteobacteria bacterium]